MGDNLDLRARRKLVKVSCPVCYRAKNVLINNKPALYVHLIYAYFNPKCEHCYGNGYVYKPRDAFNKDWIDEGIRQGFIKEG